MASSSQAEPEPKKVYACHGKVYVAPEYPLGLRPIGPEMRNVRKEGWVDLIFPTSTTFKNFITYAMNEAGGIEFSLLFQTIMTSKNGRQRFPVQEWSDLRSCLMRNRPSHKPITNLTRSTQKESWARFVWTVWKRLSQLIRQTAAQRFPRREVADCHGGKYVWPVAIGANDQDAQLCVSWMLVKRLALELRTPYSVLRDNNYQRNMQAFVSKHKWSLKDTDFGTLAPESNQGADESSPSQVTRHAHSVNPSSGHRGNLKIEDEDSLFVPQQEATQPNRRASAGNRQRRTSRRSDLAANTSTRSNRRSPKSRPNMKRTRQHSDAESDNEQARPINSPPRLVKKARGPSKPASMPKLDSQMSGHGMDGTTTTAKARSMPKLGVHDLFSARKIAVGMEAQGNRGNFRETSAPAAIAGRGAVQAPAARVDQPDLFHEKMKHKEIGKAYVGTARQSSLASQMFNVPELMDTARHMNASASISTQRQPTMGNGRIGATNSRIGDVIPAKTTTFRQPYLGTARKHREPDDRATPRFAEDSGEKHMVQVTWPQLTDKGRKATISSVHEVESFPQLRRWVRFNDKTMALQGRPEDFQISQRDRGTPIIDEASWTAVKKAAVFKYGVYSTKIDITMPISIDNTQDEAVKNKQDVEDLRVKWMGPYEVKRQGEA